MFECLVGYVAPASRQTTPAANYYVYRYPPFCSESTTETYHKIIAWQNHLAFPDDVHLSVEAEDMIRR